MFPDFKDLIALLNKHKAKYLVIGGYAVARRAQPRATKGLGILPMWTNCKRPPPKRCTGRSRQSHAGHPQKKPHAKPKP